MEDRSRLLLTRSKSYTFKNFQAALKIILFKTGLCSRFPRRPGQLREIHNGPQLVTGEDTCPKRKSLGNTSLVTTRQYRIRQK